jgi:hypothetical protein
MGWNPWQPLPGPQTQAFESQADELFYGGSSGGGKTSLLLMLAIHAHEHSVIFRRTYPELKEVISTSKELLTSVARYNSTDKLWRDIPGRKTLELGAIQHEDDKDNWRGRAHDLKAFDEITSFSESQFRFISAGIAPLHRGSVAELSARAILLVPKKENGLLIIGVPG